MITMERSSLIIVFLALVAGCAFDAPGIGAGNGGLEGDGIKESAGETGDAGVGDAPLEWDRGLDLDRGSDWEPNLDWDPEYDWENPNDSHRGDRRGGDQGFDSGHGWEPRSETEQSLADYAEFQAWLIDLINSWEIPCAPEADPTGCWPGTICNPDTSFCEVPR